MGLPQIYTYLEPSKMPSAEKEAASEELRKRLTVRNSHWYKNGINPTVFRWRKAFNVDGSCVKNEVGNSSLELS